MEEATGVEDRPVDVCIHMNETVAASIRLRRHRIGKDTGMEDYVVELTQILRHGGDIHIGEIPLPVDINSVDQSRYSAERVDEAQPFVLVRKEGGQKICGPATVYANFGGISGEMGRCAAKLVKHLQTFIAQERVIPDLLPYHPVF